MSYTYTNLELEIEAPPLQHSVENGSLTALESVDFPFEALSDIAQLESWRKEINRPIYHIHKWWAQRLGSIFRGILIAAAESNPKEVVARFYEPVAYPEAVVLDPFMGSGTTIGEALKLGMRAIGQDINPVAYFSVRTAFDRHPIAEVMAEFERLEREVAGRIKQYYAVPLEDGSTAEALYYFWVKWLPCPACDQPVDLFSSYVFSRNAYPKRHPLARVVCPACGEVNEASYDATNHSCISCGYGFDPQQGPAQGQYATCPSCSCRFSISKRTKELGERPQERMYAKLVLLPDGRKVYMRITQADQALYHRAEATLALRSNAYPVVAITPGHNTNQVLNYGYRYWHEFFNARQLLNLSQLADAIRSIRDQDLRNLFVILFSGTLEFNNTFASFKGEGTGAVRHMFSHHILKPERAPLEANLWGTPKSSGSFSTLFKSRLLRALEYRDRPFEVRPVVTGAKIAGEKVFGVSPPLGRTVVARYVEAAADPEAVYLACGDSSRTDIPDGSVDLVITDPPFFDNVHYSELADFFHVWQCHLLGATIPGALTTTRSADEVQSADAGEFSRRLANVFAECHRVLSTTGVMAFTYHHSRPEGWQAVQEALQQANLVITAAHPVKAEMSGATPKSQASSPIDIDVIIVCRRHDAPALADVISAATESVDDVSRHQVVRFVKSGRKLSKNDVRVIVMAQLLKQSSQNAWRSRAPQEWRANDEQVGAIVDSLAALQATIVGDTSGGLT